MGENDCNEAKAFYKQKITEMVANCDTHLYICQKIIRIEEKPRVCALPLAFLYSSWL